MDTNIKSINKRKLFTVIIGSLFFGVSIILMFLYDSDFLNRILRITFNQEIPLPVKFVIFIFLSLNILLIFNRTRKTGWFVLGCSTAYAFNGIFHSIRYFELNSLYALLILISCIIWIFLCFWIAIKDGSEDANRFSLIKKLENKKNELDLKISCLYNSLNEKIIENKVHAKNISDLETCNEQYKDAYESTKIKLYESQLISAFHISMAINWPGNEPFALHYLQGNLDHELADFIGETNNTFWLLEMKRGEEELATEFNKKQRVAQFNSLIDSNNLKYRKLGDKCHWLGYGENLSVIKFLRYWDNMREGNLSQKFDLNEFIERSFSAENPIGVNHSEFDEYITFLLSNTGSDVRDNLDNIPAYVFKRNKSGRTSIMCTTLFKLDMQLQMLKEQRLIKERQLSKQQNRGYSMGL